MCWMLDRGVPSARALGAALAVCVTAMSSAVWAQAPERQPVSDASPTGSDTSPTRPSGAWSSEAIRPDVILQSQVFGGWSYVDTEPEAFNAWELGRAELGLWSLWERPSVLDGLTLGTEARVEAIRSAGPQSLLGVDGDSLVFRAKRAWGFGRLVWGSASLTLEAGLIPDPWLDTLYQRYDLRGVGALASEVGGLFGTSDLGAGARLSLWSGLVEVRATNTNGEGRNLREQNTGKNTTVVLNVNSPAFGLLGEDANVSAHALYRDGSVGLGQAADHRLAGALSLVSAFGSAGFEYARADGFQAQSDRQADALSVWLNGYVWRPWVGLMARYERIRPDAEADGGAIAITSVALYTDFVPVDLRLLSAQRFRLYVIGQDEAADPDASPIPGAPDAFNAQRVIVLLSINSSKAF